MKLLLLLTLMLSAFAQAVIIKGDRLSISIKGVPTEEQGQVNGSYPVSSAGKIYLTYLTNNPISASGLSTDALARKIEAAYKKAQIFTTPSISIRTMTDEAQEAERSKNKMQKFYRITGAVGSAGPQPYRPGLTIIDVISIAGTSGFAATKRVELLRNGKTYIYNMEINSHMMEKIYPEDHITVKKKNFWGK